MEISDAIRDKLRLTLFLATEVQATFWPDRYGIRIGPIGLGEMPGELVFEDIPDTVQKRLGELLQRAG